MIHDSLCIFFCLELFYPTLLSISHCAFSVLSKFVCCLSREFYKSILSWMKFVNRQPWCESDHLWLLDAPNHRSVQAKQFQGKIWITFNFSNKNIYISVHLNFKHIPNKATEHIWLKPNGFCKNFIFISVKKDKMS